MTYKNAYKQNPSNPEGYTVFLSTNLPLSKTHTETNHKGVENQQMRCTFGIRKERDNPVHKGEISYCKIDLAKISNFRQYAKDRGMKMPLVLTNGDFPFKEIAERRNRRRDIKKKKSQEIEGTLLKVGRLKRSC